MGYIVVVVDFDLKTLLADWDCVLIGNRFSANIVDILLSTLCLKTQSLIGPPSGPKTCIIHSKPSLNSNGPAKQVQWCILVHC